MTDNKAHFILTVRGFNARSSFWLSGDTTTNEGTHIQPLTSYYGFEQVINEPTRILANSAFCINLISTGKPKLVVVSGTLPSFHEKCHHQIIYSKLNLNIVYSRPYKRLIWDYKKVNIDSIRKSLDSVN